MSGYIDQVLDSTKTPGLAVAVARRGRIIWERGYGWAIPERRVAATPHTLFGLASVSKSITGLELMLLSSRGLVDPNAPVTRYLAGAKLTSPRWNPQAATVRRIATHTAGLTSFDAVCYDDEPDCDRSLPDMIRHHGIVFWKPGTRFDYSNLGYGILSYLIGQVTHRPFAAAVKQDLLARLGIRECAQDRTSPVAPHYQDGVHAPGQVELAQGASGLACSVDALVRLGMFMLKDKGAVRNMPTALVDQILAGSVPADDPTLRYSSGWWINPDQHGYRLIYASGGTLDSGALLYTFPSADLAIAIAGNGGNPRMSDVADQIAAKLLPGYAAKLAKRLSRAGTPVTTGTAAVPRFTSLVGTWTGEITTWAGTRPVRFIIRADGSTMASINGAPFAKERNARVYRDGFVLGAHGDVDTPETNRRRPYRIGFELYRSGAGALEGAATTWQDPGARNGGVFSYPVQLIRDSIERPAIRSKSPRGR